MNWYQERRFDYIDWSIATHGELQRADIVELFSVSEGQASVDINNFIALYPDAIKYNKTVKRYVSSRANYLRCRSGKWVDAIDWIGVE